MMNSLLVQRGTEPRGLANLSDMAHDCGAEAQGTATLVVSAEQQFWRVAADNIRNSTPDLQPRAL
jgi:hypothetical protein